MEIIFNRRFKMDLESQEFAENAVGVASLILGISPPESVEFFVRTSPSRDPDLLTTQGRALGFCREGVVYLRTDLKPAALVRTAFHECRHIKQIRSSCATLKVSYSSEADERDARLFTYEHLSGLKDSATRAECMEYLEKLRQKQSQELRAKFAPLVRQAAINRLALLKTGGLKKFLGSEIEYR